MFPPIRWLGPRANANRATLAELALLKQSAESSVYPVKSGSSPPPSPLLLSEASQLVEEGNILPFLQDVWRSARTRETLTRTQFCLSLYVIESLIRNYVPKVFLCLYDLFETCVMTLGCTVVKGV